MVHLCGTMIFKNMCWIYYNNKLIKIENELSKQTNSETLLLKHNIN